MTALVVRADAHRLPLQDECVDLIITSPPYFALRSYRDQGEHYDGQVGSEPTPQAFLESLWAVTAECWRALKPEGVMFVNLGDKRSGQSALARFGRPKSKMLLPHRYAIGCEDGLADPDGIGWIVRQDLVWHKCLSGGAEVYARVNGREKVLTVKDLARTAPGSAELWTGERWSAVLRCDPTPPTDGRTASSLAARRARYLDQPVPPLVADLEIEFRNGVRVGCTPNHKWPTARGVVRADELTVGDVVPMVRLPAGTAAPAALDDEMTGWLVGLYIAEGSRSEDMVQIAGHVRETERHDRLAMIAEAFDGRLAIHPTGGNAATANLSGKLIRAVLDTYVGGRTARDKRLAPACWRRTDTFLRALLDGYLSGDGHYEVKTDRWRLGFTANDGLATDLRTLGARLGLSIRLRRAVHRFDGREFPGWSGTIYDDPARRKRPDSEVVAVRQSRARQFWNIEIADEPHEFALACGILTENSNGLPESVQDRPRDSHEFWFMLCKGERYFSAVDEIRQPHAEPQRPGVLTWDERRGRDDQAARYSDQNGHGGTAGMAQNPLGKLPDSVWTIPTEPLTVPDYLGLPDHFAAFPTEWPRRLILGWSPHGVCVACGQGRRPCTQVEYVTVSERHTNRRITGSEALGDSGHGRPGSPDAPYGDARADRTITGYRCACTQPDAPTRPAVILDPFGGTGTVALVARALGRHAISVDLSHDYCKLARWRIFTSGHGAKAVARTDQERQGQLL